MSEGLPTGNGAERERASFFGRRRTLQTPTEALQPEAAPPPPDGKPPSRRSPMLSSLSGFLSFLLIVALVGLGGMTAVSKKLDAPGPLADARAVYIPPRTEVMEIIDQLEKASVIDQPLLMRAALVIEQKWRDVKAGEYLFPQNVSLQQVIDILVAGRSMEYSITIPEGLTSQQIVQRLRDNDILAGDIRDIPSEGSIMPDTYRVTRGMLRTALVRQMSDTQTRILNQVWERRASDLPLKSKGELVTLASIVEKETGRADERTRVASVFHNRLQRRMKLQSDPTIVYGIVGGRGTLGRAIQRGEIMRATPFNTYVIDGLPPTPIANPGRAAMEAVANPSKTRDLYFVANGTGGHAFAETLEQHNRNVVRWREIERETKAKAAPGTPDPVDVDRVAPDDATTASPVDPARLVPARRSDAMQDPVFGGLSAPLASATRTMETGPVVALMPTSESASQQAASAARGQRQSLQRPSAGQAVASASPGAPAHAMAAGIDGLIIRGVNDQPASQSLDGPADSPEVAAADMTVVPLSAARRAEQEARMARFGKTEPGKADTGVAQTADLGVIEAARPMPTRPKILDASEGTRLDPLRNTSWDLNSAKTVPAFRAMP